ncbi:MAG: hypothetical protein JW902_15965 [Syntrophaceae bacterium]|nr:hypothetical protein [Syntrophaceae bacterium]
MSKPSKETLMLVAANLTVAEMIYGMESDTQPAIDPAVHVTEAFKKHLARLESEND